MELVQHVSLFFLLIFKDIERSIGSDEKCSTVFSKSGHSQVRITDSVVLIHILTFRPRINSLVKKITYVWTSCLRYLTIC